MRASSRRSIPLDRFDVPGTWVRAILRALCVATLSPLLSGCATLAVATWGPPPPDLAVIKVGVSRETVEQALGKPVTCRHNVCTYEHNTRDVRRAGTLALAVFNDAMSAFLTAGAASAIYGVQMMIARQAQRAKVSIVYGPRDTVIGPSHEAAEAEYRRWLGSGDRKEHLGVLCSAANAGFAPAQSTQAMRYWYGLWDSDPDRVRGYLWLRLAAFGGHGIATEAMTEWAASMRPEEIAEADRLFRDWEPEAC